MKPVFVIALVLLCCCFAAKIKKPQNPFFKNQKNLFGKNVPARNQLGRAEAETKILHVKRLPCTFSVKFYMKNYMGPGSGEYSGKFKKYGTNLYGTTTFSGYDIVSLLRTDIKEAGKPLSAFCFFSEMVGDQCTIENLGFTDDYTEVQNEISPVVDVLREMPSEFEYETEEETTWEGFKCKKYGIEGGFLYVKDDYLIGSEFADSKLVFEYKFDDMREDMVVPEECEHDLIPEAAYSAPKEDKTCKSKVEKIDLKELPCTYSVKETENYTHDGSTYTVTETLYKVYGTSLLEVYSKNGYVYNTLVRGDIKEAGSSTDVLVVRTETYGGECEVDDWYYDDYADYADFLPSSEVIYCQTKEDAKWEGEKCTDCAVIEYGAAVHFYVKDGLFIGYNIDAPDYVSKGKYEYIYEDVREEIVFNKSCDLGVYDPVPEKASSAPDEIKDCKSKPKSDASSSISVVASMIISMIMITLISLF